MNKAITGLALTTALLAGCTAPDEPRALTIDRMVAISDGDHAASTYVDGVLAPRDAGFRDVLTTMSVIDGEISTAQVEVPNSVTAAPEVLALTPDGGTAFVAERLAARGPGTTRASELAAGTRLTAIDITDIAAPQVITTATVAQNPEAISVSPDGARIAVVANTVLQILDWTGDAFGEPASTNLDGAATNVHWHPDGGRALAVNIDTLDQVVFMRVDDESGLQRWGAPVRTGVDPFVGRFTPDGRHYITANWGRDLATTVAEDRLSGERSTLSVIELGDADHRVVAEAESDVSSEGLAISPDGTMVATVNMRGTVFPPGSARHHENASVSLFRLDGDGTLSKVGDYPLTAVLPEGGTFDASGEYFIATSFQGRGDHGGSGLQVYRVDEASGLVPVQRISLPHGTHHVVVG